LRLDKVSWQKWHKHVTSVIDIEKALLYFKEKGMRLIDEKHWIGAGGTKLVFLHPKFPLGVLVEVLSIKRNINKENVPERKSPIQKEQK
jgi:hypothetical protein